EPPAARARIANDLDLEVADAHKTGTLCVGERHAFAGRPRRKTGDPLVEREARTRCGIERLRLSELGIGAACRGGLYAPFRAAPGRGERGSEKLNKPVSCGRVIRHECRDQRATRVSQ